MSSNVTESATGGGAEIMESSPSSRCPFSKGLDSSFRNLFGPANPKDLYVGGGTVRNTSELLRRLAGAMEKEGQSADGQIPAGYTYLAQFTAHDLVHNPTRIPNLSDQMRELNDLREQRLMLETLYGGGPGARPHLYVRKNDRAGTRRSALRLHFIDDEDTVESVRRSPKSSIHSNRQPPGGAYRDLPRLVVQDGPVDGDPYRFHGDALVADPRNDDHLIISQLTVLFALLHNAFVKHLENPGTAQEFDERRIFLRASKATILVYRKIVFSDLLPEILNDDVLSWFNEARGDGRSNRLEDVPDRRMTTEFAHAVFRAGHCMVRPLYELNNEPASRRRPNPKIRTIRELIDRRSATNAAMVPHVRDWLVAWSQFFDLTSAVSRTGSVPPPQVAKKISRNVEPALSRHFAFGADTGAADDLQGVSLLHADLLRGAFSRVRTVDALIEKLTAVDLPGHERLSRDFWEPALKTWLRANAGSNDGFPLNAADVEPLTENPPLLLYILHEAELEGDGGFGVMGSAIVAETFFSAKDRTEHLIEDDLETRQFVTTYFQDNGINGAVPESMPSLIDFLARHFMGGRPKHPLI